MASSFVQSHYVSVLHLSQVKLLCYTKTKNVLSFASLGMLAHILRRKTKGSNLVTPQVKSEENKGHHG